MREKTIAFTGHRPDKLFGYNKYSDGNARLLNYLYDELEYAIVEEGFRHFITGMALGWDIWAGQVVLKLREKYKNKYPITLECAIPCDKQYIKWKPSSINEWQDIVRKADIVTYVSNETFTPYCMQVRNEYMVDNAGRMVSCWDGTTGGTGNCIKYAKKKNIPILNISPRTFQVDFLDV